MSFPIAPLTAGSIAEVVRIASLSFPKPWEEKDFAYFFKHPCFYGLGAWNGAKLAGYFIGLLILDDLDTISIACDPELRRQGVGRTLLSQIQLEPRIRRTVLEVDTENVAAIELYRAVGFQVVGTRKRYYENRRDAYLMCWQRN